VENCDTEVTKEEGTAYQLFQEMRVDTKGAESLKKTLADGSPTYWWLRSSAAQTDIYFIAIDKEGEFNPGWSDAEYGVAPCFCI
jgi:hypothetical protein